jgi:murein DD-endopeptidase MepM/ murein hydrolase activator NlpD
VRAMIVESVLSVVAVAVIGLEASMPALADDAPVSDDAACAVWHWPVRTQEDREDMDDAGHGCARHVLRKADIPAKNWQKGHRGVDLPARRTATLVSPTEGTVMFSGRVAGKDVVTLRTDTGLTVSFEPAVSARALHDHVRRGEQIGTAEGGSDHCGSTCVHVGVRRGDQYLDPLIFLLGRQIRLKPAHSCRQAGWQESPDTSGFPSIVSQMPASAALMYPSSTRTDLSVESSTKTVA